MTMIPNISDARLHEILAAAFSPGWTVERGQKPGVIVSEQELEALKAARIMFETAGRIGASAQGRDLWNRLRVQDRATEAGR